jgi:hypothetical protein
MPTPEMKNYWVRAFDFEMTEDGTAAVISFAPHGEPPVSVHVPRAAFEVFVERSAAVIARPPRRNTTS